MKKKSDGWLQFSEQQTYDQIIGKAVSEQCFMYSAEIVPQGKGKTFIIYDPNSDQMYTNKQIIN